MNNLQEIIGYQLKITFKKNNKIDPFKYFLGHKINSITTLDAQWDNYAFHNFSGLHSGSNYKPAWLSSRSLLAPLAMASRLSSWAVTQRRFTTVVVVFRQLPFEFMDPLERLGQLLQCFR